MVDVDKLQFAPKLSAEEHQPSPSPAETDESDNTVAKALDSSCERAIEAGIENLKKKRRRLGKNPDVDTSFLPDVDRDEEEKQLR